MCCVLDPVSYFRSTEQPDRTARPNGHKCISAGLNEDDCFQFDFIFFIQFNLHLIDRKVKAVIFKRIKIRQERFLDFFVRFLRSIWGVCPTRLGVSHETEANRANLCLFVDCFRGEIHQSRNAGPPERPQRETQRPLAQSRPLTATQKKSRPAQTQFFIVSRPPKPHEHQPGHDYAQKFDRCILVAAARVGLWGGASPRKKP